MRYYLRYENDQDLKRAKLILFFPFRNELKEIHEKDINDLFEDNQKIIEMNHAKFENKFNNGRNMTDIIEEVEKNQEERLFDEVSDNEDDYEETTSAEELKDFNKDFEKWKKELKKTYLI